MMRHDINYSYPCLKISVETIHPLILASDFRNVLKASALIGG